MLCRFCKKSAGWFSAEHPQCRKINKAGFETLHELTVFWVLRGTESDYPIYQQKFDALAAMSGNLARAPEIRFAAVEQAFQNFLGSGNYDELTADNLYNAATTLLTPEQYERIPIRRLDMMGVLHNLSYGRETHNPDIDVFHLTDPKPGEFPVWTFRNVNYFEEKTRYGYEGRSSGVSVRLAKGVSVRMGQSHGHRIEHNSLERIDNGYLTISNRRLHFMGSRRAFRLFFEKLALIQPYADGLKIIRDRPSAKPQLFQFEDAWFASEIFRRIS